jgi:hypothetical protein
MMALRISDKDGVLGVIRLTANGLAGDTPAAQRLASQYQARHGEDAYNQLAQLNNGYVAASEQPE